MSAGDYHGIILESLRTVIGSCSGVSPIWFKKWSVQFWDMEDANRGADLVDHSIIASELRRPTNIDRRLDNNCPLRVITRSIIVVSILAGQRLNVGF